MRYFCFLSAVQGWQMAGISEELCSMWSVRDPGSSYVVALSPSLHCGPHWPGEGWLLRATSLCQPIKMCTGKSCRRTGCFFKELTLIFHISPPLTFLQGNIIICPHLNSKGLWNRVPTWKVMCPILLFSKEGRGNAYLGITSCLQWLNSWRLELLGSELNSVRF